jgi:hypothetical protein
MILSHMESYIRSSPGFPVSSALVERLLSNDHYHMRDPSLLQQFLRVHLLERHFDFITYYHIPRSSNYVSDDYANYVLDWHLSHI